MSGMRPLARLVDTALDRTVVGGYTRLGYLARKRMGWPEDPRPGALAGRVAVVTGGGGGLGKATALGLAGLGAAVLTVYTALTRQQSSGYLCDDCKFNDPEKCKKPERPHAIICTSYRRIETESEPDVEESNL